MFLAADELVDTGCALIQYRNKSGNARVMLEQVRELKKRLDSYSRFSQNRGEVGHPFHSCVYGIVTAALL